MINGNYSNSYSNNAILGKYFRANLESRGSDTDFNAPEYIRGNARNIKFKLGYDPNRPDELVLSTDVAHVTLDRKGRVASCSTINKGGRYITVDTLNYMA